MDSKQRMLAALCNEQPDMVPVAPDTSNYIPCRMTRKDYRDIYLHNDHPLWQVYIECVKHFKFDGWFIYGRLGGTLQGGRVVKSRNGQCPVDTPDENLHKLI